jgi:phospholipase/carboxylesterase
MSEPQLSLVHRSLPARQGSAPHPALVLLHGLGDNEAGLFSVAGMIDPRVHVFSVRAPLTHRWGGYSWFDLEQHGPGLGSPSIEETFGLIRTFLDEMIDAYPVDPQRIYFGGFSQGAAMAGAVALLQPDRVAGAVMVSGFLPPDDGGRYRSADSVGHPFFQAHGTLDSVVPLTYAHMTRDFLSQTPVDLTYREYQIGHTVTPQEIADVSEWFGRVMDRGATAPT